MKPKLPPEVIATTTVLAIDDHEPTLEFLVRALRHFGFEKIEGLADPRNALERFAELKPGLVLIDCYMPFLTGFQVVEKIREINGGAHVPILMLSGSVDDESRATAREHGIDLFIPKPVMLPDLADAITEVLQ